MDNRMNRMVARVGVAPVFLRRWLLSRLFGRVVPFLATAGLRFEEVGRERLVVSLRNRHKVQNHIHGLHACAMALLAETASGFVVGMNVPDDRLMLLKSMKIDYLQRSQGDMQAVAVLRPEQLAELESQERGNVLVDVVVTDQSGNTPIVCEMLWAWLPKKPKEEGRT